MLTPPNATPGEYTGAITISAEGIGPRRVPIELTVWDFMLPETPSIRTYFGDADVNPLLFDAPQIIAWGGLDEAGHRALQIAYAELMAAHRISSPIPRFLTPKVNADGSIHPQPTLAALQQWIVRLHITGVPMWFLGIGGRGLQGDFLGADRKRNGRYLRSIYSYVRAHHWDKMAYLYVADDPSSRYRSPRAPNQTARLSPVSIFRLAVESSKGKTCG